MTSPWNCLRLGLKSMNKCSTELQSGWDWKAPLEVIWFQHLTQAGPLEPAAKDDDQIVFEYLSPLKETPQPLYATLCHWSVTLTIREHVLMSRETLTFAIILVS